MQDSDLLQSVRLQTASLPEAVALDVVDPDAKVQRSPLGQNGQRPPKFNWRRFGLLVTAAVMGIGIVIVAAFVAIKSQNNQNVATVNNYAINAIPLSDVSPEAVLGLAQIGRIDLNGVTKVNGALILSPQKAPANPVAGQIYFSEQSNSVYYYDGQDFKEFSSTGNVVKSVNGISGDIRLGPSLSMSNGVLSANIPTQQTSPVTSVQGQKGDVAFLAGSGVAITGTTISNSGVLSVGGQTGALTVGRGLSAIGGTLASTSVITSGSANIVVTDNGNGNYTISDSGVGAGGNVALAPLAAQTDSTTNPSIFIDKTDTGDLLSLLVNGTDTFKVNNSGLIVTGSINYSQVTGRPATTVLSVGGASGAITVGTGLSLVANDLANTGVTNLTGTPNQVTVSAATGSITLTLPQNIAATSTPTFASLNLTSALSIANGGTGATSAAAARSNLSAAASGANSDITSLTGLTVINPSAGLTIGNTGQSLLLQGNASTVFTATNGGFTTTVGFTAPTANRNVTFPDAGGTVCLSSGNCPSTGIGGGGTANKLAIFTGSSTLADSIVSQNGAGTILTITGDLSVTGALSGNGSGLTALNGSNVSSGTVADARLSSNVTVQGNTFNGASQLVQLTAGGLLPTLNASNLTTLNASALSSGTVADARLSSNVTLQGSAFNAANQLVQLNGSAQLPAVSGALLTTLNATNVSSGTLDDARLSGNVTLQGNAFNAAGQLVQLNGSSQLPAVSGTNLTNLNGSSVSSGIVGVAFGGTGLNAISTGDLLVGAAGNTVSKLTIGANNTCLLSNGTTAVWGSCTAGGGGFTSLNLAGDSGTTQTISDTDTISIVGGTNIATVAGSTDKITIATVGNPTFGTSVTSPLYTGAGAVTLSSGAGNALTLTSGNGSVIINANTLSRTGPGITTLDLIDAVNTTLSLTNSGAGAADLSVDGTVSAANLVGDGSGVTAINASNITSGTLADARLSGNVTLKGNSFNGTSELVLLDASGFLPALNGGALTALNASNLSSGTLADARLSGNVTLKGNSFNGVNELVLLDGSGFLPALNGGALTSLNGSAIASGTVGVGVGGTGATTAAGARTSLGAAASGANSDITSLTGLTVINPSAGLTIGNTGQSLLIQGSATTSLTSTAGGFTSALVFESPSANATITVPNATGTICLSTGNCLGGAGGGANTALSNLASVSINTSLLTGNSTVDLGSNAQPFNDLYIGGAATTNFKFTGVATATRTITVPDASGTLCLSTGNCAGAGTGITGSGTANKLAVFSAGQNIVDSIISQNAGATIATITGDLSVTGTLSGNGSGLTNLDGGNISTGTVADARLTNNVTIQGNAFNGTSQLVQTNGSGQLPAISGVNVTNLNGSNVASGTINDLRLSSNVTLKGSTFNGANQLVNLDGSGFLPALNGAALTSLNATNITSGTVAVGVGGTGITSYATGDLIYASGVTTLSKLAAVASGQCLISQGVGVAPVWGSCASGGSVTTLGPVSGTSNANGGSITGNTLNLAVADGTNPGLLSTSAQTIAGAKTFSGAGSFTGTGTSLAVSNDLTVGGTINGAGITGGTLNTTSVNGVTTADIIVSTGSYADPSWITSLAKSKVGLSNVENTALSTWNGSTNLTTLGTITSGTWTGSVIADGYINDALTVSSAGNVDWAALTNYPSACAAGTAITALADVPTCAAFASASGSGSYIQNSTALQSTANLYIRTAAIGSVTAKYRVLTGQSADVIQVRDDTDSSTVFSVSPSGALTASSLTGNGANVTAINASNLSTGTVAVGVGGTGLTSYTTGDLIYASGASTLNKLAAVGSGQCLVSNGVGVAPSWGACGAVEFTNLTLAASSGPSQTISNTDTITLEAGDNITTTAGATDKVTIATVSNPSFTSLAVTTNATVTGTINGASITGGSVSGGTLNTTSVNGVTTADIIVSTGSYADPSWITSLAKSKVGLSNVENTALSTWNGSTNLTTLGTITSGTWTGSVIADGYINDALTVSSAGNVDWAALTNYPSACAAGSAITGLGDTPTCTAFAPTSGSGSYIQNGIALQSGANTYIQSATTTDVTAKYRVLGSQSGDIIQVRDSADTTTLFSVSPSGALTASSLAGSGTSITSLNGSNIASGIVGVGVGGTGLTSYTTGDLLFASGTNTIAKLAAVATGQCLISQGIGVAPTYGSCAVGSTLQGAYTGSTGGTTPEIKLDTTRNGLDIQDADTSINGNLLTIRSSNGSGLGDQIFSVSSVGDVLVKSNSVSAFSVQDAAGNQNLVVDNTNGVVVIPGNNDARTLGAELVTNTDFTTAGWTTTGSWTLTSSDATHIAGTADTLNTSGQAVPTPGAFYSLHVYFTGSTGGCIYVAYGGWGTAGSCAASGSIDQLVQTSSTADLSIITDTSFDGKVTGVSIKQYSSYATPALRVGSVDIHAGANLSTFIGTSSGAKNLSFYNTGFGRTALQENEGGWYNSAFGDSALQNNNASYNTAIGSSALRSNTTGSWNTASGYSSLYQNTTGTNNAAYGASSLSSNTTGGYNVGVGTSALYSTSTGYYNTGIGNSSGYNNTTGSYNLFLGYNSGGTNGSTGFTTPSNLQYATAVGSGSIVQQSYSLVLGQQGTNVGIGTTTPLNQLSVAGLYAADNNATASQSGNTVTGTGTSWTSSLVGMEFVFSTGKSGIITGFTDATHLTLNTSQTVAATSWRISRLGLQVTSQGLAFVQATDSSAFKVKNDAGQAYLTVDTQNSKFVIGQPGGSGQDGKLVVYGTASNYGITLATGATTGDYTITLPTSAGSANDCLKNSGTPGVLQFTGCSSSSSVTLQGSTPGTPDTGNFNVSGTGIADILQGTTKVETLLVDATSAVALNIGTTNASQINLNKNTQVTGNLTFASGASRTLSVANQTSGNTAGNSLTLQSGSGFGTGAGGAISLQAGASGSGATGAGGAVTISGGSASSTNGAGGAVSITSGASKGTGTSGAITISTSSPATYGGTSASGNLTISTGNNTAFGGTAGAISIAGGNGNNAGAVSISSGNGSNSGNGASGADLHLSAGSGDGAWPSLLDAGNGGNVYISAGSGGVATAGGNNGYAGNIVLASGNDQYSVGGSVIARSNGYNSTSAFQVQNASSVGILTTDTVNSSVLLGTASSIGGKLVFNNASNANAITLVAGATTGNYTLTLPTSAGSASDCLKNSGTAGILTFGACGSSTTLQGAYTASTGGTTSEILLDTTRGGVDIQDRSTSNGGTIGSGVNLFAVRATAANDTTQGLALFSIDNTGKTVFQNSADTTGAFQIKTAGGTSLFNIDTFVGYSPSFKLGISTTAGFVQGYSSLAGPTVLVSGGSNNELRVGPTTTSWGNIEITANINSSPIPSAVAIYGLGILSSQSGNGSDSMNIFKIHNINFTGGVTTGTTGQTAGKGGAIVLETGTGGAATGASGANFGGAGGAFSVLTANGGNATSGTGGAGGDISLTAGNGGNGSTTGGRGGNITLAAGTVGTGGTPTQGKVIVKNTANSTTAFQVQNSSSTAVLTVDTTNQTVKVRSLNDAATLGSNLFANSCTGGNWSGSNPYTHTTGSTNQLTCTTPSITAGATYEVTYTTAGTAAGEYFTPSMGGGNGPRIYGDGSGSVVITTTTTANMTIAPTSAATGSFTVTSVKLVTNASTPLAVLDSTGTTQLEVRATTYNTGLGRYSLQSNTTGSRNTAVGNISLQSNTTGSDNAGFGYAALQNNTTGFNNVATGSFALYSNNTGSNNTANGQNALSANSSGYYNAAFGSAALQTNNVGIQNTGIGGSALSANTSGSNNTAVGYASQSNGTITSNNTSVGYNSLQNATGSYNTAVGSSTFVNTISGVNNTALGFNAGTSNGGFTQVTNVDNATAIGAYALVQASNSLVLGQVPTPTNVGIGTTIPINTFSVSSVDYAVGTISQTASTTVVGSGTTFTAAMVGDQLIYADGTTDTVTGFTDATHITVTTSRTHSSSAYRLHYIGLQVKNNGTAYLQGNSTAQLQVKNGSTKNVLTVDSANGQVILGDSSAGGVAGKLAFNNTTNTNAITLVAGASASNFSLTLPTSAGSSNECLKNSGTAGVLTFGACGGGTTLQGAYDAGSAGDQVIQYSNTNNSVIFRNPASSGTTSNFALKVDQLNTGSGVDALAINNAGTSNTLNILNAGTSVLKVDNTGNLLGVGASTATTGTTEATARTNVTTVTLTAAGSFANNDIIFINNAGQDYYTRIVSGAGTTTLTVSPEVSYDASATVTKYTVQNIGATSTDYTTQSNRFFQGYFLGGVVTGAGSTTLSDGSLKSTNGLQLQTSTGVTVKNTADSTSAFQVQNAGGTNLLSVDTSSTKLYVGPYVSGTTVVNDPMINAAPTGTLSNNATWYPGQYLQLNPAISSTNGQVEYTPGFTGNFDAKFQMASLTAGGDEQYFYAYNTSTPTQGNSSTGGYTVAFNELSNQIRLYWNGSQLASGGQANMADGNWHQAEVQLSGTTVKVYWDGSLIINYTDSNRTLSGTKFGLGAWSGGARDDHRVRLVTMTSYAGNAVPSLTVNTTSGQTAFTSNTNSATAFQVQNSAAGTVLGVDTANNRVGINTNTPGASLDIRGNASIQNLYDTNSEFSVLNAAGGNLLSVGSSNNQINLGTSTTPAINEDLSATVPGGTLYNSATYVAGQYVQLIPNNGTNGQIAYTNSSTTNFDTNFQFYVTSTIDDVYWFDHNTAIPTQETSNTGGYKVAYNIGNNTVSLIYGTSTLITSAPVTYGMNTWHSAQIIKSGNTFKVYYDGSLVITYTDSTRTLTGTQFGLGAWTGSYNGAARVKNLTMTNSSGGVVGNVNLNLYGLSTFQASTNSTNAFRFQDASGVSILTVDSTNKKLVAGAVTAPVVTNHTISDSYTTTPTGALSGSATYVSGQYIDLTPSSSQTGAVEYNPNIESDFDSTFQFNMNSSYSGLMLYALNNTTPGYPGGATGGYQIAFDWSNGQIYLYFNGSQLTSSAASLNNSSWRNAEVVKTGTNIKVYLDSVLKIDYTDSAHIFTGTKVGLAGYTNCCGSNKQVRNFVLNWTTTTPGTNPTLSMDTATGQTIFQTSTNDSTAFQVQDSAGATVLNVDTTNQRIGINLTNPSVPLEVGVSSATSTYTNGFESGALTGYTNSNPVFPWTIDANSSDAHTGSYSVRVEGVEQSDLSLVKTVGTGGGVLSFWYRNPYNGSPLDLIIDGSYVTTLNSSSYAQYITALTAGTHTIIWRNTYTAGAGYYLSYLDDIAITNTVATNQTAAFDGSVSINSSTVTPNFVLDVNTGGASTTQWLGVSSNASDNLQGGLLLHQHSNYGFQLGTQNTSSATQGKLVFDYRALSDGSVTTPNIMTLQANGNVGIGTTSPQTLLHVGTPSGGTYFNGFETGLLGDATTTNNGSPWQIDSNGANAKNGSFSVYTNHASGSGETLTISKTLTAAGKITFWFKKTSDIDVAFKIDGVTQQSWNGYPGFNYGYHSYNVGSGSHTFTWVSSNGYSGNSAWIDDISITNTQGSVVSASFDGNVGVGTTNPTARLQVSGSNTTTALQVQNTNSVSVLNVDTTNGQLQLGSYNGGTNPVAGSLVFNNTTNANAVTLVAGATASNYTLTLPTSAGSANQCLQNSGTAGILTFASCGGNLQGAYTASTGGTTPEILLDSTRGGVNIQNAFSGGVTGGNLFAVTGAVSGNLLTGAQELFAVTDTGIKVSDTAPLVSVDINAVNSITQVDYVDNTAASLSYSSYTGFPVIAAANTTSSGVDVVNCLNFACTRSKGSLIQLPSFNNPGHVSITGDGGITNMFPRLSIYDSVAGDLYYAQCNDKYCSDYSVTSVDSTGDVGQWNTIAVGYNDGLARIAYYDATNQTLKLVICANDACTSKTVTTVDATTGVGTHPSLTINSSGFAQITYYNATLNELDFVQCTNINCTTKNKNTISSSASYSAIQISQTDGLPRIAYRDDSAGYVYLAVCSNASCSSKTTNAIDTTGDDSGYNVHLNLMTSDVGAEISYANSAGDLKYAYCANNDCSLINPTITTVVSGTADHTAFNTQNWDSNMDHSQVGVVYYDTVNGLSYFYPSSLEGTHVTSSSSGIKLGTSGNSFGNIYSQQASFSTLNLAPQNGGDRVLNIDSSVGGYSVLAVDAKSGLVTLNGTLDATATETNSLRVGGSTVFGVYPYILTNETTSTSYDVLVDATTYYLSADSTTTNANITTTFNLSPSDNLSENGRMIIVKATSIKGTTAASRIHTVAVKINGTTVATLAPATNTTPQTVTRSMIFMKINGTWTLIGQPLTTAAANTANSATTADFAEWIHYSGNAQPQPGEVLVVGDDPSSAKQSSQAYDKQILGVVSSSPYDVGGIDDGHSVVLALTGRAPVRVSLENGPIHKGDRLTSSSTAGVAMKAITSGNTIGTALEDYDGSQQDNLVLVQLQVGYAEGTQTTASVLQGSGLAINGNASINGDLSIVGGLNVAGMATLASLTVNGDAVFNGNITVQDISVQNITINGHIITSGSAPVVAPASAAGMADSQNNIAAPVTQISGNDTAGTITVVAGSSTTIGDIANLTFSKSFSASPRIIITPVGAESAKLQTYVNGTTTTGFALGTNIAPQPGQTYTYNYQIMQ